LIGVRSLMILAGVGVLVACAASAIALRRMWQPQLGAVPAGAPGAPTLAYAALGGGAGSAREAAGQERPDLVGRSDHWLALLDDLRQRDDHPGVELGARVGG
jgi:hypothetical protein